MVPGVRIERTTCRLQGGCSTTELTRPGLGKWGRRRRRAEYHSVVFPRQDRREHAMPSTFRVACIHNCAEREMAPSIAALTKLIRAAAKGGAELIQLPEMATMIEPRNELVLQKAKPEA